MPPITLHHDGSALSSRLRLDGGKHGFAHIVACAALADHLSLRDVPDHVDARAVRAALERAFVDVRHDASDGTLVAERPRSAEEIVLSSDVTSRSRSLFGLIPALLKRAPRVVLESPPAGCAIGSRPSEWYLRTLEAFGARTHVTEDTTVITMDEPRAARVAFPYPTMTGSVIAIAMAASIQGRSRIENVSSEPSVDDEIGCARALGAEVERDATGVWITGAAEFPSVQAQVPPDRIHAVTYLMGALLANVELTVEGAGPLRVPQLVRFFRAVGADFTDEESSITVRPGSEPCSLRPVDLAAGSEPLFSSDWGAFAALLLAVRSIGTSVIQDDVFVRRFQFAEHLRVLGLDAIHPQLVRGPRDAVRATVRGSCPASFRGGPVPACPDIRGSAALLLAGLVSDEPVTLDDDFQISRGHTDIRRDLRTIGFALVA